MDGTDGFLLLNSKTGIKHWCVFVILLDFYAVAINGAV